MNDSIQSARLRARDVRRRFDRAAASFDANDFAHAHARNSLLARLEPMQIRPKRIVDLGCASGASATALSRRFTKAQVLAIDQSAAMLERLDASLGWFSRIRPVLADAAALPLPAKSVDMVFSNMLLPWIGNPDLLFREVSRVLKEDSLFMFSALGPDSLANLVEAFAAIDESPRVNAFPDMHDIGDGLVRAGLKDPVLDVDRLKICYSSPEALFRDLSAVGARNALAGRRRGLLGRVAFNQAIDRLGGAFDVELEIVYGHAWGSGQTPGGVYIDAGRIPVRRR